MTITAKIIADSVSPHGARLTTLQLRYPRFIHAEELTHRVLSSQPEMIELVMPDGVMYDRNLSRNASSSRAIPVSRLIEDVERDPVMPSYWGKNQPGMQAREECDARVQDPAIDDDYYGSMTREQAWYEARGDAIKWARAFSKAGYHKQIVNRLLEPFSHINVVVSATEWSNFLELRCHPDAQPEIRILAEAIRDARHASTPKLLKPGEWHLPYAEYTPELRMRVMPSEWVHLGRMLSAARCARTSYLTHEGKPPLLEEDVALYQRVAAHVPPHASPTEHQATPDGWIEPEGVGFRGWAYPKQHGNFVGWRQFRHYQ